MYFNEGMLIPDEEADAQAQYEADEAAHQAAMEEEWRFEMELDQAVDSYWERQ